MGVQSYLQWAPVWVQVFIQTEQEPFRVRLDTPPLESLEVNKTTIIKIIIKKQLRDPIQATTGGSDIYERIYIGYRIHL